MKSASTEPPASLRKDASLPRKLAEWVSLGVSAIIVASLAGYLVYQGLQPNPPQVPIELRPLLEQVREEGGRHILPLLVVNRGRRTVRDLKVELEARKGPAEPVVLDVTLDYLGERSEETVYFLLDAPPGSFELQARASSYRLD